MNRIRDLRLQKGWRQEDLAQRLNTKQQTIARYETEKLGIDAGTICALCDIFGCTADYLLGRSLLPSADLPYTRREQPADWMLKGLVRCSACGSTLVYQALKCPSMQCHKYARGACKVSHSLSVAKANRAVLAELRNCVALDVFPFAPPQQTPRPGPDFARLLAAEEQKLRRIQEAYEAGVDSLEEYKRKKTRLTASIEDLRRKKEESAEAAQKTAPADMRRKVLDTLEILESPTQTEQAKNTALRSILAYIIYDKPHNQLQLYYRF